MKQKKEENMCEPLISIIVPVYKTEQYLQQCVDSLLHQSYENIEIILVDDGSPDQCPQLCDWFSQRDNRIKVVHQKNAGLSAARNKGIQVAKGDWIGFVDSDDWVENDLCSSIVPNLNNSIDIYILGYMQVKNGRRQSTDFSSGKMEILEGENIKSLEKSLLDRYYRGDYYKKNLYISTAWGKFYRGTFLKEREIVFESVQIGEDMLFNTKCFCCAERIALIDHIVYNYRKEGASITNKYHKDMANCFLGILSEIREMLFKRGWYDSVRNEFYIRAVSCYMFCVIQSFCHLDNATKYRMRKNEFLETYNWALFYEAIKKADFISLPLLKKMICTLIRKRCFWGLNTIVRLTQHLS